MSIITISRGSYSRGKEVAEKLSQKLGYECISRDLIIEASNEFNIPEIKLKRALHDAPSVLERFTRGKERYIRFFRSALLSYALKDNIVYHGLAGHYFLKEVPHVLKVRIIADFEDRVGEEMKREGISELEARYILKKDDEERRKWGLHLYGIDTWDPQLYDLVLHIGRLTADDAVDILHETVQKDSYKSSPLSQKILNDLALSARVENVLVRIAPKMTVRSDDGIVFLKRNGFSINIMKEMKTAAERVKGVRKVIIHELSVQKNHVNSFYNIG
jgi:cytidylate kinase